MSLTKSKRGAIFASLTFILTGCLSHSSDEDPATAPLADSAVPSKSKKDAKPKSEAGRDAPELTLDRYEVLAPGELAFKVYAAFGPGMTKYTDGNSDFDFLAVNSANFVGSVSNDPNNKYASKFSISYFMALAGLSTVVANNYADTFYAQRAVNDCATPEGAGAIITAIAPGIESESADEIATDLVAACKISPADAVKAIVQSYSFALKAIWEG